MSISARIGLCAAVAALLNGSGASAQTEQWLQYRTTTEGRGYQMLQPVAGPAAAALPNLGSQTLFFEWQTPLDNSGKRLLVLTTRSGNRGMCDRLYIDTNGDGKLDDEKPVDARQRELYGTYFDPVRLVFKGADGSITYHVLCQFRPQQDTNGYVLISSGGYYEGKADFGGRKRRVQLFDRNANGTFNDAPSPQGGPDIIQVEEDKTGGRAVGALVDLEGQYYRLEVARDGAWIKVAKADNLQFGKVRVPQAINTVRVRGANGDFVRTPEKGEFAVPAGTYGFEKYTIGRKDDSGGKWEVTALNFPQEFKFEVKASDTVPVQIGEPLHAVMQSVALRSETQFRLQFVGSQGERIYFNRDGQNPKGPRLAIASPDGTARHGATFEFG